MYSHYTLHKWLATQQYWRRVLLVLLVILLGLRMGTLIITPFDYFDMMIGGIILVLVLLYFLLDYFYFQRAIKLMLRDNIKQLDRWMNFYQAQLHLLQKFREDQLDPTSLEYRYLQTQDADYFVRQKLKLQAKYQELAMEKEWHSTTFKKIGRL